VIGALRDVAEAYRRLSRAAGRSDAAGYRRASLALGRGQTRLERALSGL
jgi:hypothetical protein